VKKKPHALAWGEGKCIWTGLATYEAWSFELII